jgi:selenide,water dikinase
VHAEATGLDLDRRLVLCRDAEPVSFDVLSLDIGSAPRMEAPGARDHAVPVKPVAPFLERWEAVVAQAGRTGAAPRIAVVGGGAGGVEAALAMRARLKEALARAGRPEAAAPLTLVTRGGLLPRFNARARAYLRDALARAEIAVQTGFDVARVEAGRLVAADGRVVEGDHLFWVTWAGAPAWLGETGLALDGRGFVAVDAALRATSHPFVFAAGDVAAVLPHPRDKAGVFAVRQGPPLADNLRRALRGEEPRPFTPQRTALALVGTGDGRAVAARGPLAMRGAWVWRLKQRIDRAWMDQYRES